MKVTLTTQEIISKLGLPADTELIIEQGQDGEWISNVGRDVRVRPESLSADTKIEVKYRDGETDTSRVDDWESSWKETDGHPRDIIAYRILKD